MLSKIFRAGLISNQQTLVSKNLTTLLAFNKTYGNLKDQDRIFTNVYRDDDPFIKGALKRVTKINIFMITLAITSFFLEFCEFFGFLYLVLFKN